jgi:Fe-S-cluster containining protein
MIETEGELTGRRLSPGDAMPFRCGPELACFNSCCRNKRLTLLPYDVLRLSRRLRLTSGELLERYVELEIEPSSGWPTLRLRLAEDGRCLFVARAGCSVYPDRPTCCRIYPLARAVGLQSNGEPIGLYVAPAASTACLGFGAAPSSQTVEAWAAGQGLGEYRAVNDRVAKLFLHPRRTRPMVLSPNDFHAVIMALYNLDVFRERVQRPGFSSKHGLTDAAVERALASPEALLELGQDWIAARLFGARR